jgi:phage-related holin
MASNWNSLMGDIDSSMVFIEFVELLLVFVLVFISHVFLIQRLRDEGEESVHPQA